MELYAKIKRTSKYAHQGRDLDGREILFEVRSVVDDWYAFRMGGNQYRREDLAFYVRTPAGKLIRLS